jgi:uncharacterized integral membrane protein
VTAPDPRPAGTPGEPLPAGPSYSDPSAPPTTASGGLPAPGGAAAPGGVTAPGGLTTPGTAAPSRPAAGPEPARHTGRTIGRTLALALLVFVTVVLVLFVVFNTQTVDISLVFTDVEAPLVVALLVAAGLGALVVALAGLLRRARRSR